MSDSVKDIDIVGEIVERRMDEVEEHYEQTMKTLFKKKMEECEVFQRQSKEHNPFLPLLLAYFMYQHSSFLETLRV